MTSLSAEALRELKGLAEKAAPGPWVHGQSDSDCCDYEVWQKLPCAALIAGEYGISEEGDAAYIAAASPDVILALLAERERLLDDYNMLLSTLSHITDYWNRDQNEKAMADALWHIIEEAEQALAAAGEE